MLKFFILLLCIAKSRHDGSEVKDETRGATYNFQQVVLPPTQRGSKFELFDCSKSSKLPGSNRFKLFFELTIKQRNLHT